MKQSIHCLLRHDSVLRQLVIILRLKAPVKRLQISIFIFTSGLNNLSQFQSQL